MPIFGLRVVALWRQRLALGDWSVYSRLMLRVLSTETKAHDGAVTDSTVLLPYAPMQFSTK